METPNWYKSWNRPLGSSNKSHTVPDPFKELLVAMEDTLVCRSDHNGFPLRPFNRSGQMEIAFVPASAGSQKGQCKQHLDRFSHSNRIMLDPKLQIIR